MSYQDPSDPLVAEQMFVRGTVPQMVSAFGSHPSEAVLAGMVRDASEAWRARYPPQATFQETVEEVKRVFDGEEVPIPAGGPPDIMERPPRPARDPRYEPDYPWESHDRNDQWGPADMSDFMDWAGKPMGIGKKECAKYGIPWKDVTFRQIAEMDPEADKEDIGFLHWYLSLDVEDKGKWKNANIAKHKRVKAMLMEITGRTPF